MNLHNFRMKSERAFLPLSILCIILTTLLVYSPVLNAFFDPQEFLTFLNFLKADTPVPEYLTEGWSFWVEEDPSLGFFRPVPSLTYLAEYVIFQGEHAGYKYMNLLFHLLSCTALALTVLSFCGNRKAALAAGAIFAFHPGAVDATSWISARPDILTTLFSILAVRYSYILSRKREFSRIWFLPALLAFLALMSKELGMANFLTLPIVYFLWPGSVRNRKNSIYFSASIVSAGIAFFLIRLALFGGLGGYGYISQISSVPGRIIALFSQVSGTCFMPWFLQRAVVSLIIILVVFLFVMRDRRNIGQLTLAFLVTGIYSFQTLIAYPDFHYAYISSAFTTLFLICFVQKSGMFDKVHSIVPAGVLALILISFGITSHNRGETLGATRIPAERIFRSLEIIEDDLSVYRNTTLQVCISRASRECEEMRNVPIFMEFLAPDQYTFTFTSDEYSPEGLPLLVWRDDHIEIIN